MRESRVSAGRLTIAGRLSCFGGGGRAIGELAEPDVAVAYGVVVVLELDRAAVDVGVEWLRLEPVRLAPQFLVVLDEDAVVEDGQAGPVQELASRSKRGRRKAMS